MGTVVISIDAELGWGFHDREDPPWERIEAARDGWTWLADRLDDLALPATWAVVGHLFLDACDGVHADHPAPEGWFDHERATEWPARYRFGHGLVERLLEAPVDHDVGSHTFSHVQLGSVGERLARAELEASVAAAADYDCSLDSLVFPRNDIGHRDLLADAGFTCYRGRRPDDRPDGPIGRPLDKLARATIRDATPPVVSPSIDEHGLVNVPASLYCFGFEGAARTVVSALAGDPIVRWARNGVDVAAREGGVFHVWLHPNNVVAERDRRRMRTFFEYVAARRDDGAVTVATMADVAERHRRSSSTVRTS